MVVGDGGWASSEDSWMEISMLEFDVLLVRENGLKTNLGFDRDVLKLIPITCASFNFCPLCTRIPAISFL